MRSKARAGKSARLIVLVVSILTGCDEQILHDLTEQDANKVLSRLSSSDLAAQKVLQSDGRWSISVSKDQVVPALNFLDSTRVLTPRATSSGAASKSGFVPSREEQRFRYERSVALSIEESLAAMHGVLEARVHLNLPESDPLFGTRKDNLGSGSVLLVTDSSLLAKDEEIAALVSGAAGIPAAKVSVLRSQLAGAPAGPEPARTAVAQEGSLALANVSVSELGAVKSLSSYAKGLAALAACVVAGFGLLFFRSRHRRVVFQLPAGMVSED
jgi:type III secretion protein J